MSPPSRPAVSVLLCSYNRLPYLRAALDGAYAQTFADFEVLLVDDASTDGTAAWAARNPRPGLRFFRMSRNSGPAAARNRGLIEARGEFVAFLDSDDLWRPSYLATLAPLLRPAGRVAAFSNWDFIDARGRPLPGAPRPPAGGLPRAPLTSAAVVRRSALQAIGGFDENFRYIWDDIDAFCRLALRFGREAFRFVDAPLVSYRRHGSQVHAPPLARVRSMTDHARGCRVDAAYFCRKHERWLAAAHAAGGAGAFEHARKGAGSAPLGSIARRRAA